eukprot:350958-Chlamydomonas_euryale.AAC.4
MCWREDIRHSEEGLFWRLKTPGDALLSCPVNVGRPGGTACKTQQTKDWMTAGHSQCGSACQ